MNFYNKDRKYRKMFRRSGTKRRHAAYIISFMAVFLIVLSVFRPFYAGVDPEGPGIMTDVVAGKTEDNKDNDTTTLRDVLTGVSDAIKKTDKEPYFPDHTPAEGTVTDGYGPRTDPEPSFHYAIDIAGDFASPIYAAADGEVIEAGIDDTYGFNVTINHIYDGYKTKYAHMCTYIVTNGRKVKKGEIIGFMGSTGYSTGVHLHFEVIQNGKKLDPAAFIKIKNGRTVLE